MRVNPHICSTFAVSLERGNPMPNLTEDDLSAPASARGGKRTQVSQLLSRLRNDIVCGRLPPSDRLVVATLAESYDVGQTPVREALMRLVSEGFVTLEDQRGFSVAPVSREELVDLTSARADIDGLALRASIEHGDDAWEAALLGAWHRLQKMHKIADDGLTIEARWRSVTLRSTPRWWPPVPTRCCCSCARCSTSAPTAIVGCRCATCAYHATTAASTRRS